MTWAKNQNNLLPLQVGMTAALSGRYPPQGQQTLLGVQTWVEETNRPGGVHLQGHRRTLELSVLCRQERVGAGLADVVGYPLLTSIRFADKEKCRPLHDGSAGADEGDLDVFDLALLGAS